MFVFLIPLMSRVSLKLQKGELQNCMVSTVSTIQSTGKLLYDYYTDITAAQLKAYALAQLSFMFLTVYEVGMKYNRSVEIIHICY